MTHRFMAVSGKKKKYIRRHYPARSLKQLAQELDLPEAELKEVSAELGLGSAADSTPDEFKRGSIFRAGLAIMILAVAVYAPGIENKFVIDDKFLVLQNPVVRGERPLSEMFTSEFWKPTRQLAGYYRPLVTLSYRLNYRLSGESPAAYHLANVIIHGLNSLLLFLLLLRWTQKAPAGRAGRDRLRPASGAYPIRELDFRPDRPARHPLLSACFLFLPFGRK